MLRALVLVLLLANLAYWAYTRGHLEGMGLAPIDTREPHRLAEQVAPEALVVLNPARSLGPPVTVPDPSPVDTLPPAVPVPEPAQEPLPEPVVVVATPATPPPAPASVRPVPPTCWQATGLTQPQEILVRAALDNMDGMAGLWGLTAGVLPARWIVYLGPFPSETALQQRRAELRRANIDHRALTTTNLAPGLALGTFSTQEAAERALATVTRQGVSGARVVQERPDTPLYTLTLEGVTDAQRRRIEATGILRDRPLQRCP